MTPATEQVLARLEVRLERERELFRSGADVDMDLMMLAIGRDAGRLLNLLAKMGRCRRLLEAGTSVGYSTLWLADAAAATGGRVVSTEQVPGKHVQARENLSEAGLIGFVELHTGDALATVRRHAGPFDFALLDLWKDLYIPVFAALAQKLAPGALIAADNMIAPQSARPLAARYRRFVAKQPGFETVLLPVGSGIELTRKRKDEGPMPDRVSRVLARLERRAAREDALRRSLSESEYRSRLGEFMLPVGAQSGRFLNLLVKHGGFSRILELGTSAGYSTLWLALGARATGGRVQSIDHSPAKHAEARATLQDAGLAGRVELITAGVLDTLARLPGPFDFVLLDYNRGEFIACLDALRAKLAPGAVLAADNMIEPAATRMLADAYRAHLAAQLELETVLVPIGNGIELTRKAS
ncbi:MAG: O-methyltransferase [SAR324 cluster bacterium]